MLKLNNETEQIEKLLSNVKIIPNHGLSIFKLGEHINTSLSQCRKLSLLINQIEIFSSTTNKKPCYIYLKSLGIKLRFDPYYQKLDRYAIIPYLF